MHSWRCMVLFVCLCVFILGFKSNFVKTPFKISLKNWKNFFLFFFSLLLFGLPCLAAQQQLAAWPSVGSASPPALAQAAGPAPQPAAQQRPATDRWGPLSVASATVSSPTWGRTGAESRAAAASARCSPVRASLGSPAPIKGAPLCAAPPPKTLAPAATPNPSSRRRRRR